MTSLDKIRESLDEVVAQVMLSHADQLRNEVSQRLQGFLEEDAKHLAGVEQELRERSTQAKSLEEQLGQTRTEIADKQKHVESIQQQVRTLESESNQFREQAQRTENELRGRVGELEKTLHDDTERLKKESQELNALLELSQDEVKQLQKREEEQKNRLAEFEKQMEELRTEMKDALKKRDEDHKKTLKAKEKELADKSAEYEQRLENSTKTKAEALEAKEREKNDALAQKEQELKGRIAEVEQLLELAQKEAQDKLQGKEHELLEQIHLLEELMVQGQHAREQQLEAKDRELQEAIEEHKNKYEDQIKGIQAQIADRDKLMQSQGSELQNRILQLEKELAESQKQLSDVRAELKDTQAAFEQTQRQLDELTAKSKQREEEFATQLQKREQEFAAQVNEHQQVIGSVESSLKQELERAKAEADEVRGREENLRREHDERQLQWKLREEELLAAQGELQNKHGQMATQKTDLEGMQGLWEQRENELSLQLNDFEKRLADYAAAEREWQKREHELLGHRDKVLSSSAEAAHASEKQVQSAMEDQGRLQTQLDGMLDELAKVRDELQRTQEEHYTREKQMAEEIASLQTELANRDSAVEAKVVVSTPRGARSASAPPVEDAAALSGAIKEIHGARTQTEILKALLEGASVFSGRSGIMVVHASTATGWAGRGFGSDAEFRRLTVDCEDGIAARVVQARNFVRGSAKEFDAKLVDAFGGPEDGQCFVFPLVIRDRVAAFYYADCGSHVTRDVAYTSIDQAVRAAGEWLDELAKNKHAQPQSVASAGPMPVPVAPKAAPATAKSMAAAAAATATVAAPENPADGADVSRQRARRFAKLLVDEIKLYNKDAVDAGRKNHDLYDRLRESIDKSRASYEKRWGKQITDIDYFREELVRNLAENNVTVLGNNFR